MRRLLLLAAVAAAPSCLRAQWDARAGTQLTAFSLGNPTNTSIREIAVPLFFAMPYSRRLTFDIGTSYANSHVTQTADDGKQVTSDVTGFTDTQVRATYSLGRDYVVLTGGINLPTGREKVAQKEQLAAGLMGSEFLAFPIPSMGTSFGATAGAAVAAPIGTWNIGLGGSVRKAMSYEPFEVSEGSDPLLYVPGNEYRARIGVDHSIPNGRVILGFTYSRTTNDELAKSVFNTGDRYIGQLFVARGAFTFSGANMFRHAGTYADSSYLGYENLDVFNFGYGKYFGNWRVEPAVETRLWIQQGLPTSAMATAMVRSATRFGHLTVAPSGGFSFGRVAAVNLDGTNGTALVSGFRAALTMRLN